MLIAVAIDRISPLYTKNIIILIGGLQAAILAWLFSPIGDTTYLCVVWICLGAPIAVSDIDSKLDLSPALISHHLLLLRAARLVKADRHGTPVFYVTADQHRSQRLSGRLEYLAASHSEVD